MNKLLIFTDGSVNVQSKIGFGAYLAISEGELLNEDLQSLVKVRRFENTASSQLEIQTLLWALNVISKEHDSIVYTDSQTIVQLPKRRNRLEQNNYMSKKGIPLKNGNLYKELFALLDEMNCEFVKVRGHQPTKNKNEVERIFALVDKASRKALRNEYL